MRTHTRLALAVALLAAASLPAYAQPGSGPISGGGGGGAGVTGLTSCADGTAITDNALLRGDGTTKCQGSTVTVADSTGNLQWEGTTADDFEGNFTFADPTEDWTWAWSSAGALALPTGTASLPSLNLGTANVGWYRDANIGPNFWGFAASTPSFRLGQAAIEFVGNGYLAWGNQTNTFASSSVDTLVQRASAGIVRFQDAIRLTPSTSPPVACAAGTEGTIYSDTSHALCYCDGTSYNVLTGSGAGSCS